MVAFQGQLNESVKKKAFTKQNFNQGIKYLIGLLFISAPAMLCVALLISGLQDGSSSSNSGSSLTEAGINLALNEASLAVVGIGVLLIIGYFILLYKSIRYLIFPCTKKDLARNIEFKAMINEKGVKYQYNGITRNLPYKQIKKVYDEEEYFEVTGKKINRGFIIQKDCCFEGNIDEVNQLFNKKLSKHRQTNKKKNDSNYLYSIIGIIISIVIAVFAKQIFALISVGMISIIDGIINEFLMPISEYFFTWLTPTDDTLANIVIDGLFLLWIVFAIIATIWLIVLLPTLFLLLLVFPSLVAASFILPLKQLTINKKPLSFIAIGLAVLAIVIAILRISGIF